MIRHMAEIRQLAAATDCQANAFRSQSRNFSQTDLLRGKAWNM
jgi:hypothetical protein